MKKSQMLLDRIRNSTIHPLITKIGKKIEKKHFNRNPIIIGASPRSGTTLLLSILDAYPNIHSIQRQTYAFTKWTENETSIPPRIDRLYREFLRHRISPQATRWCEKTPRNIGYFDKILNYFNENVKLINMIRDGRDVVTSKHPLHRPDQYWVSVDRWVHDVKAGLKFKDHPQVFTIQYENLIFNFDQEVKKLSQFLNESFIPTDRSWKEKTSVKKSKHWAEPIQDLHARSIKRWKKSEHKKRIEEFSQTPVAKQLLKELGYEI
ncbi:MAG: sulfotransferase [bacterium]